MVAPGLLLPAGIPNGMRHRVPTSMNMPAGFPSAADVWRYSFEDWIGSEGGGRSIQEYLVQATAGAVSTADKVAPDSGDTVTIGLLETELSADPAAAKGVLRRQDNPLIAVDGLSDVFFAHRFRMQSLVPDGGNYEVNAGGLALLVSTTTLDYDDGVFLFFDRTLGVESWVIRCARGGVSADIDLSLPWDNAFHTVGFIHYGDRVVGFVDGAIVATPETGATIEPASAVHSVAYHLVSSAAGTDDGTIQSDWVWWGRFNG